MKHKYLPWKLLLTQNQMGVTVNKCRVELEISEGSAFKGGLGWQVPVCKEHSELAAWGEGLVVRTALSDSEGHFHFWLNNITGI